MVSYRSISAPVAVGKSKQNGTVTIGSGKPGMLRAGIPPEVIPARIAGQSPPAPE